MSVAPVPRHEEYRDEVISRYGEAAWTRSNSWWTSLSEFERKAFLQEGVDLRRDYAAEQLAGSAPETESVLAIVSRHLDWITQSWGGVVPTPEQFAGLGDMYVADARFARNYGGTEGATFVRDAIRAWLDRATPATTTHTS